MKSQPLPMVVAVCVLCFMFAGTASWSQQALPGQPPPAETKASPPRSGDQPKCVVKEVEFDAGKVPKGTAIVHDFIVENTGKATLSIIRVQPGCGCTVTKYDEKVEPGKSGKITATVSTNAFSGPINKSISVATSDPQMGSFQLSIKADVRAPLNVSPSDTQQMGLTFQGQTIQKEFAITAENGAPFQITSVQSQDPELQYEVTPSADKKSAVFKVTLPASHSLGPITGRFTLSTTHPEAPSLGINVYGTVREPLTVSPTTVTFPGINREWAEQHPDDPSLIKAITIVDDQAPELEIKSAACTLPNVGVVVRELEIKKRFSIELHLKSPFKVGDFSGEVKIATSVKELTVPVRVKIF